MKKCLVIGFGNTLRADDGLGPHIAERLGETACPHVHIMAIPQLDVILISEIHKARLVIFVDARADDSEDLVKVERVEPAVPPVNLYHTSHSTTMSALLRMALDWYGAAPPCYAVMPKGYDFSIGESLSREAQITAIHARDRILEILRSHTPPR